MNQDFQIRHGSKHYRPCNQYKHRFHYSHHRSLLGGWSVKSLRGFGGLQGSSGQTPKNGDFGPFRPFLGVCPEPPWRPPNSLILLKCSPIVLLKHMTDWRHLLLGKCEILRMAAHFSPSCLGLMGNFCSSVDLLFQVLIKFFFHRWITGGLT